MIPIERLTAEALGSHLAKGDLTQAEIVLACLARIATRDERVRAWKALSSPLALAETGGRSNPSQHQPLQGIPVGVKDVILTQDLATQYNSEIYQANVPSIDAACVSILRSAGALILGKTDTVEFAATGRKALTRNPHDLARTPGGSSSGSAAAVADFHVPLTLGTQTGGSMIRPASYCGVFAMKPTWGLISTEGVKTFSPTLDTIGWFARSAGDLKLLYDVFDPDPAPDPPPSLSAARIAICRSPFWSSAEPATKDAMSAAEAALWAAGFTVSYLELPEPFDRLLDAQKLIMEGEGQRSFLSLYRSYGDALHPNLRAYVLNEKGVRFEDLRQAYDLASRCRTEFDQIAGEFDAVLTPSTVGAAPIGLQDTGPMTFNAMWTLLHAPCINWPFYKTDQGLPVGLTVTGPRYSDRRMLAVAAALEALSQA